jgi:hypothetical protein
MHHGQPNAGAFAGGFGREEGVVDALHNLRRHAMPRIPHGQPDVRAEAQGWMLCGQHGIDLDCLQAYLEDSAGLAHSVLSIRTQVHDDLV